MSYDLPQEFKEKVAELCLDGLLTNGVHHKQWYLEQILKTLGYSLEELRDELKLEKDEDGHLVDASWHEGIAP